MYKYKKVINKNGYKYTKRINKKVIEELLKIKKEKGLTCENVVKVAKDKKNPLHHFFEWNDEIAGEKWRLEQAGQLIREVLVVINGKIYRGFENVKVKVDKRDFKRLYEPTTEVLSKEELKRQVLRYALTLLESWKEKYEMYSEFKPIIREINKIKKKIK